MKICWDNIENIRLNENGNFKSIIEHRLFYYNDSCIVCGEPFLGKKSDICCSIECGRIEQGRKLKEVWKDDNSKLNSKELSLLKSKRAKSKNNPFWKGGYYSKGIPTYDTYAPQIEWCEEVRRNQDDPNILEVKCFKCGKWYIPNINDIHHRSQYLKGNYEGEYRLYCSQKCKKKCSIYGKSPEQIMKGDAVKAGRLFWLFLKREVQPELRKLVLERDGNQCVKCGSKGNLQCHHIDPVANNPIESADVDNCITLCKNCHKKVHQKDGCKYNQLKVEIC